MIGCLLKFLSAIALGLVFYFVLTPLGMIARLFGHDPLRLSPHKSKSYWIDRKSSDEAKATIFKRQY